MITFYLAEKGRLQVVGQNAVVDISRLTWVDMLNPTDAEEAQIEKLLGINIPTREEMHEIELSNRFYQENDTLYATASIVTGANTDTPEIHAITFVLIGHCLITIRYSAPSFFKVFCERMQKGGYSNGQGNIILAGLLEAIINRIADILEAVGHQIDDTGRNVFRPSPQEISKTSAQPDFAAILRKVGVGGDLISKLHESLTSISRLISFIGISAYYPVQSPEHRKIETLRRDIQALNEHAGFLSNKISFLLDATLGMVNIQQNSIIKIFSVVAVIFLPPTLVASIYGMNFSVMPELRWPFGYPMAIIIMMISAFLPYLFFRKKGWL